MHTFLRGNVSVILFGDLITFIGSLILTLAVRYQEIPEKEIINQHLVPFLFLFAIWILIFFIAGLYDKRLLFTRREIPGLVLRVQVFNVLIAALFFFLIPVGIEPKTNLVIYLVISSALIAFWRLYVLPIITPPKSISTLIVGDSPEARAIAHVFVENPYFKNIQTFTLRRNGVETTEDMRRLFDQLVADNKFDVIIADMRDSHVAALAKDFYRVAFEGGGAQFFNLPAVYEQLYHRVPPSLVGEVWFLENITTEAPHYAYDFLKRVIDIVGALVLLLPCMFIFPFVMLAIKLQDGGVIFYKTKRVGQGNAFIDIIKFRSMTGTDDGTSTLNTKLTVTPLGNILRKTRIDELPQLLNVLRGDLSFIGPRPELPARAQMYAEQIPYYNMRHNVKPGLSGWAQINNFEVPRGEIDVERTIEKLSFDLYYLKHRSLFLDIEIVLKTLNTLLARSGT